MTPQLEELSQLGAAAATGTGGMDDDAPPEVASDSSRGRCAAGSPSNFEMRDCAVLVEAEAALGAAPPDFAGATATALRQTGMSHVVFFVAWL